MAGCQPLTLTCTWLSQLQRFEFKFRTQLTSPIYIAGVHPVGGISRRLETTPGASLINVPFAKSSERCEVRDVIKA